MILFWSEAGRRVRWLTCGSSPRAMSLGGLEAGADCVLGRFDNFGRTAAEIIKEDAHAR